MPSAFVPVAMSFVALAFLLGHIAIFGVVHEAGHGLYEQGLDQAWVRSPLGHPTSLGVHESPCALA